MIHLITYGNSKFEKSKQRLKTDAKNSGWFDTITVYEPNDLDNTFKEKFKNILDCQKGAGYWIWKSEIIKMKLKEINDGNILIYLDAGCSINTKGKERFKEYIDLLNKNETGVI